MRRLNRNGRNAKHGGLAQQHRKEHVSWYNMLTRCTRPSDKSWADYGGRGITVCDRWLDSFTAFFEDMGPKPSPAHQLERVDNDKGYSPENCVWATREEQARNKRNSVKLEYEGKTWICADLARHLGISGPVLRGRVNRGWQPCDWGLPVGMKPSQSVA